MKKIMLWVCASASLLSATFLGIRNVEPPVDNTEIHWLTMEEAIKANADNPKKLFIDMYTDWCGWCKVMDKKTFTDPAVIKVMNESYYAVKFNAEQQEPVDFKGKTYKFLPYGKKGIHELAYTLLDRQTSYPSFVILDKALNPLTIIKGYKTPEQFLPSITINQNSIK